MKRLAAPATVTLIASNVLIFILMEVTTGSTMRTDVLLSWGAASTELIQQGQYWRLVSAMFLHSGMSHLANNMLLLFVLGTNLEAVMGLWRFMTLYLTGGIVGNIAAHLWYVQHGESVVFIGASGAVFATMGAVLLLVIRCHGRMRELSIRQMLVMLAFSLYFGFASAGVSNAAHIGGLVVGFILAIPFSIGRLDELRG